MVQIFNLGIRYKVFDDKRARSKFLYYRSTPKIHVNFSLACESLNLDTFMTGECADYGIKYIQEVKNSLSELPSVHEPSFLPILEKGNLNPVTHFRPFVQAYYY